MKITDPIDGRCPSCNIVLRHVPAEKEMGFTRIPAYDECPKCEWQPGDEVNACDYCGTPTDNLVKSDAGDDYCTTCKRQEDIQIAIASISRVAVSIQFERPYGVYLDLFGLSSNDPLGSVDIRVYRGKRIPAEEIASSIVFLSADDAVEQLTKIHECLAEIRTSRELPAMYIEPFTYQTRLMLRNSLIVDEAVAI